MVKIIEVGGNAILSTDIKRVSKVHEHEYVSQRKFHYLFKVLLGDGTEIVVEKYKESEVKEDRDRIVKEWSESLNAVGIEVE